MSGLISQPRIFIVSLCFFLSSICSLAVANEPTRVYSLSVVPQFTGMAIHRDWTSVINYMNKHTPYRFKLVLSKDIPTFEQSFIEGVPDFAFMNPYHAVMAKRAQGYRPIIRDNARKLTGILVVRKDGVYNKIQDLSGQKIAFAAPNAFAAALYMRALLREREHIDFIPEYVKTHSNAYRQVLVGKAAAAGGVYRTLHKERPEVSDNLKIIYKTPSSRSHPLTAHARMPADVINAVQEAFEKMHSDENMKVWLKAILIPEPVVADYERDYQSLEKLKLDSYIVK